jgi:branched-chain amino acid transport system ATP-binding protein
MLSPGAAPLLAVEGLQAWYGESHVLHGATFDVFAGEVVTLLGRNGAGKTTTLKSIMGIVGQRTGSVRYEGKELIGLTSDRIARLGIALCPEERGIFASLDVEENLMLPPKVRAGGLELEGLAPVIIEQIGKTIGTLKQQGFTILLVEQNFRFASTVADRYYVMENGRIIDRFANAELEANLDKLHDYLGV